MLPMTAVVQNSAITIKAKFLTVHVKRHIRLQYVGRMVQYYIRSQLYLKLSVLQLSEYCSLLGTKKTNSVARS